MQEVKHDTKRKTITLLKIMNEGLINFASDLGVCYDHVDGAREVFWTERNKNELIISLRPGQEDEAQVELFIEPTDTLDDILKKISPFI